MKVRVLNKSSKLINTKFGEKTMWTFETGDGRTVTTFDDLSKVADGAEVEGDITTKTVMGKNGEVTYTNFKGVRSGSAFGETLKRLEEKIDKLQESVNALGMKAASSSDEIEQANAALADAVAEDKEEINIENIPF